MKLSTVSLLLSLLFVILFIGGPIFVQAALISIPDPLGGKGIGDIISAITGFLKILAIGVGGIMVIWSGIQIMTAGGSEEQVTKGKKTLFWTVIGVAIAISVDFIVDLVKELLPG